MKKIPIESLFFVIVFLLLFSACDKEPLENSPARVDIEIDFRLYPNMGVVGNYLICPEDLYSPPYHSELYGLAGVIVYYTPIGFYVAYDRCCRFPSCEAKRNKITPAPDGTASCEVCGSKYSILTTGDGSVINGPAEKRLYVYPEPRIQGNYLRVHYSPD